jgi:ubiquinol-cytochrome c reductase iron-sulfur subunit
VSDGAAGGNGQSETAYPVASFDDAHMQPLAKNPRRAETVIAVVLAVGLAGFAAYGGLYWVGGQPQLEGVFLGVGLFGFGFGLAAWGKYLLPRGPFVEERHALGSSDRDVEAITAAVVDRGTMVVRRRGFLGGLLAAGSALVGIVLAFPLLRSLGPQPKNTFETTNWRAGSRLVDINGRLIKSDTLEVGGIITVFPEGPKGNPTLYASDPQSQAVDQTILIRPVKYPFVTKPGRETWTPDEYVAYSKVCTHAGCPVGLYQEQLYQLLCPCHQSLFDVLKGAQQVFGPAPRPLPQLPLRIDEDGYLRAQSGYDQPIGPGFWERS